MHRLPQAEKCRVDREKILDYLLCHDHPDGASKARFFSRFGFSKSTWRVFAEALAAHGRTQEVVDEVESQFGFRYTIHGRIVTPDGRNPVVRTIWIIECGCTVPRLITAYPAKELADDQRT